MNKTALELYTTRVFRVVPVLAAGVAVISGICYTITWLLGWFPSLPTTAIILFDLSTVIYLMIGIYFVRNAFTEDGSIIPQMLKYGKYFTCLLTIIHWNVISYTFPSYDYFAFAPLFLLLTALFFDEQLVITEGVGLLVSIFVSWRIESRLAAAPDETYHLNMIIRTEAVVLIFAAIYIFVRLCNRVMVKELEKLSDYDSLTMLLNRRSMNTIFSSAEAETEIPHSVAMLDIDDFKKVNDTYGHDFGDVVLKRTAEIISNSVGIYDKVFRWGGEEILILFSASGSAAVQSCRRILNSVKAEAFTPLPGVTVGITLTAGVADLEPGTDSQSAITLADERMYVGKRSGKAKVVYLEEKEHA